MEKIDLDDLRKDVDFQTLRGSGPGGQHRNKVETTVRAVHVPTGLTVVASDHRSQLRNKILALERLRERLLERQKKKKHVILMVFSHSFYPRVRCFLVNTFSSKEPHPKRHVLQRW